jgi:hypothetical protein
MTSTYLHPCYGDVGHLHRRVFWFQDEICGEAHDEQNEKQHQKRNNRPTAASPPRLPLHWFLHIELLDVEGAMLGPAVRSSLTVTCELHLDCTLSPLPLRLHHVAEPPNPSSLKTPHIAELIFFL